MLAPRRGPRRRALGLGAGAVLCLVAAAVLAFGDLLPQQPRALAEDRGTVPATSPASPRALPAPAPADPPDGLHGVRRDTGFVPTRAGVAAIELTAPVVPVRVGADGVLDVPPDPRVLGWWADGAAPGSGRGTVVLDGHLDSRRYGTGPLAQVGRLVPGDRIAVRGAGGREQAYEVTGTRVYSKARLPYAELFDQRGPERLVLVTCGGTYRPEHGGWDSNVVVFAVPVR